MSRGANLLANLLVNPGVSDLTGSFRLYKREVLKDLVLSVKGRAYVFQMEVLISDISIHVCIYCLIIMMYGLYVYTDYCKGEGERIYYSRIAYYICRSYIRREQARSDGDCVLCEVCSVCICGVCGECRVYMCAKCRDTVCVYTLPLHVPCKCYC